MPGIYLHIPFCKQACTYCNFHFSTSLKQKDALIIALVKEIGLPILSAPSENAIEIQQKNMEIEAPINTIYLGGGTPSILNIDDLKIIFDALRRQFVFANDIEITIEANPDDITDLNLQKWLRLGINRLSVGVQSFLANELKWMNRAHTAAQSLNCINKIKAAGFTNFSVDLIYGSPLLNDSNWKKNVHTIFEKNIPHLSCYALTVEPKTALDKMIAQKKNAPVAAEKQAQQFLLLMDWMKQAGYNHYEISNFAKPGFKSKHNSSCWSSETYYGFGPSAHSYFSKAQPPIRRWNVANNALYINYVKKNITPYQQEILTTTQQLNEYIMTALRTMEGISTQYISKKFGKEKSSELQAAAKKYVDTGKIIIENEKIILTNLGKLFADGIAADLFF